jgi:Ca-activated chloride channel family protein
MSRVSLLTGGLLTIALGTGPAAQQPVFRTGTEIVGFGVTVTDRRGNFITDLKPDDLEILEEGAPQAIQLFARGDEAETVPELHIGMVFDTSGSMGDDINLARSAAVKFLNTLTDAKDMTLVDFDTEVRVSKFEQASFPRLVERIRSRRPDGFTALYDAIGVYLSGAIDDNGRKILVMFTDGGDTRSTTTFSKLLTMLRASDATVYAVGFLEHQPAFARGEQRQRIAQIALETGGEAFFPTEMKQVEEAYAKVLRQIRAQYTIGYLSTNTKQDGRWRKVEIRVKRPDIQGPRVQARKGYFAPVADR